MGIDYNVYLGAYILAEYKIETVAEEMNSCTRCLRPYDDRDEKFCPRCGADIVRSRTSRKESVDRCSLQEEFDELLRCIDAEGVMEGIEPNQDVWIPNITIGKREKYFDPHQEQVLQDISVHDIVTDFAEFNEKFSYEIAKIINAYERATCLWGLIVWMS